MASAPCVVTTVTFLLFLTFAVASIDAASPAVFASNARFSQPSGAVNYVSLTIDSLPGVIFGPQADGSEAPLFSSFESSRPEIVLIFIGSQIQTVDLSSSSWVEDGTDSLQPLKNLLESANSSVVYTTVRMDAVTTSSEAATPAISSLVSAYAHSFVSQFRQLPDAARAAALGGCGGAFFDNDKVVSLATTEELEGFLKKRSEERSSGELDLLFHCSPSDSAATEMSHEEALAAEVTELQRTVSQISLLAPHYSFLYFSVGDDVSALRSSSSSSDGRRRWLAESNFRSEGKESVAAAPKCDAACRSRTSLLEGLFAGLLLLVIFVSGIACLAGIDTPSRFEVSRESS